MARSLPPAPPPLTVSPENYRVAALLFFAIMSSALVLASIAVFIVLYR